MDETQKHFVARYLIARARLRPGRVIPSMIALVHESRIATSCSREACWFNRTQTRP
jgi:hypothetical protein